MVSHLHGGQSQYHNKTSTGVKFHLVFKEFDQLKFKLLLMIAIYPRDLGFKHQG